MKRHKEKRTISRLSQIFFKNTLLIALSLCMFCSAVLASVFPLTATADPETGGGTTTTAANVVPGSNPTESTTAAAQAASNYVTNLVLDLTILPETVTPTTSTFTNLCSGAVSWVANRAIQELTSYLISEDIDVLSDFLIAIQSPAARAEMQHKALVKQIAQIVKDIQVSVNKISGQLSELTDELRKYETAAAYERAAISLRDTYTQKYQTAWGNYQSLVDAGIVLGELETKYPEGSRTEAQKSEIAVAESKVEIFTSMFIESAKDLNFLTDIQSISGSFWDPNNKTSSYLGAYEAFLRERYTFEHQIVDSLGTAISSCIDMQNEMIVLYTEYYTYLKEKAEAEGDFETYKLYTENYFNNIKYSVTSNINSMVESMGVSSWLVADELTQEEIDDAMNIYPDFTKPETIHFKAKINGSTYNAYRVRSNADLSYYIILKQAFTGRNLVTGYSITEHANGNSKFVLYRPEFMFNGQYTDDGQFKMITSVDDMSFIKSGWTNLRAALRDDYGGSLSGISADINKVLLYNYEWSQSVGSLTTYASWQMKFNSVDLGNTTAESVTSRSVYEGNSSYQVMVVYKDIVTSMSYDKTGTKKINDVDNLSNRVFHVSDGQTLDISSVTKDASNVAIFVTGSGTIKSNPKIKLNNSNISICNTDKNDVVELNNVNVVATKHSETALKIRTACTVNMTGTNTFIGTEGVGSNGSNDDFYMGYTRTRPVFACHGIMTDGDVTLTGGGNVTATGADGGAGICFNSGNLTIKNLTVEATGSRFYNDVITVSSGIGSCVSFYVKAYHNTTLVGKDITYFISKNSLVYRGDSGKNGAGTLSIIDSTVSSYGSAGYGSTRIDSSVEVDDIGGVELTAGVDPTGATSEWNYFCFKDGVIKNSTINTKSFSSDREVITSRIDKSDTNNAYSCEKIGIYAETKGSDGVTSDGISFRLHGDKGYGDWIKAEDIGCNQGSCTQNVVGKTVGEIDYVEFKTNSDNDWFPGKISIACYYSGNNVYLYGGRWIGQNAVTIKPSDNVYSVEVHTGTEDGAGTDADISLYLEDENGKKTETIELNELSDFSNAFENGDSETFYFYAPDDFDECIYAYFYSNHKWAKADWLLESFTVKKVSGTKGEGLHSGFTHNSAQWLTEDKTVCFGKYSGKTGQFYLEVKTSDRSGAGTDSDIYLTIYGDKGNTGEVELDKYAGDGNNFERDDKDCFNIAYSTGKVGTINKIVIRKNDSGVGPDWYCDYIIITEKVANGQSAQCVKFSLNNKKIEDSTYTFDSSYISSTTRKSSQTVSREILSNLERHEDGSFSLDVDRTIIMSEEAFSLIAESNALFTLNMKGNEDKLLYSVTFDGSKFDSHTALEFKSGYSANDGYAVIDFLSNAKLPSGTVLKVNAAKLGFSDGDSICILKKGEDGWSEEVEVENKDGMLTLTLEDGKKLLLKEHNADVPSEHETDDDTIDAWIWIVVAIAVLAPISAAAVLIFKKEKKSA